MSFLIRPLRADEATSYREIRLEALRLHPDAFGACFDDEAARALAFFEQRLNQNVIFGGFGSDDPTGVPLGTAGFMPEAGAKRAHKAHLWGMYVRQAARGTGLARQLVAAVLDHARDHAELIQLSVVSGNTSARRLYTAMGFRQYGIETHSLKLDDRYLDEILMVKMLR